MKTMDENESDSVMCNKNEENSPQQTMGNVKALKMYFQSKNVPIMGSLKSQSEQNNDTNKSITETKPVIKNKIPRPPSSSIDCSAVTVTSLNKVLPNDGRVRPVPKPRKSIQLQSNDNISINSVVMDDNSIVMPKHNVINARFSMVPSLPLSQSLEDLNWKLENRKSHPINIETKDCDIQSPDVTDNISLSRSLSSNSSVGSKTKTKKSLGSFFKRTKLLSRYKKYGEVKVVPQTVSFPENTVIPEYVPQKPTRKAPPPPPLPQSRPPAPLPYDVEDFYEDTIGNDIQEELYNDAEHEDIYCTLDNDSGAENSDEFYEGIDQYDDFDGFDQKSHYKTENIYNDPAPDTTATEGIYEVLPFENDSDESSQSALSNDETISQCSKSDLKAKTRISKVMKKFNLTGNEIPVNAGIVKDDDRGSRYDLYVKRGETVLIIRMEGNPPGKWLAKNERGKIGYVHLDNITYDPESVKSVLHNFLDSQKFDFINH